MTRPYGSTNTRDWAIHSLRPYVERGDSMASMVSSWQGSACPPCHCGIEVTIRWNDDFLYAWSDDMQQRKRLRVPRGSIGVVINDQITGVYRIADLASEIRSGLSQASLFEVAS